MKARRNALVVLGFLVVLALIVPTAGADHTTGIAPDWNDAGINTRLGQSGTSVWNDAGLHTGPAQTDTVGWNDAGLRTRPTPNNTVGWNDAGTNAGRLWFYAAAQG